MTGYPEGSVIIFIDCPKKRGCEVAVWRNGQWIVEDYSENKFHTWSNKEAYLYSYLPKVPKQILSRRIPYLEAKQVLKDRHPLVKSQCAYKRWWPKNGKEMCFPAEPDKYYHAVGDWVSWDDFLSIRQPNWG